MKIIYVYWFVVISTVTSHTMLVMVMPINILLFILDSFILYSFLNCYAYIILLLSDIWRKYWFMLRKLILCHILLNNEISLIHWIISLIYEYLMIHVIWSAFLNGTSSFHTKSINSSLLIVVNLVDCSVTRKDAMCSMSTLQLKWYTVDSGEVIKKITTS